MQPKHQKRLNQLINNPGFGPKYRKNLILDVCHVESDNARTKSCYVCSCGVPRKEQKTTRYGYNFGRFYNKRHKKNGFQVYFTPEVCMECVALLEKVLVFVVVKSYAP